MVAELATGAEHHHLRGPERALQLGFDRLERAEPLHQRTQRRDVGPADEADGAPDGVTDRQGGEQRGEREPAGVHHDQRASPRRHVLGPAHADVPPESADRPQPADEPLVPAPVVDAVRGPRPHRTDRARRQRDHVRDAMGCAHDATASHATRAGWCTTVGQR